MVWRDLRVNQDDNWHTDPELFDSLPGAAAVTDWFGFLPSFHDWELLGLEMAPAAVSLRLHAFRMTSETDADGYFVRDRHAIVTLRLTKVTGLSLSGCSASIILELRIRQFEAGRSAPVEWQTCGGPEEGDYEIVIDAAYGLQGTIFAKGVELEIIPAPQA
jgi:hypothetical protein